MRVLQIAVLLLVVVAIVSGDEEVARKKRKKFLGALIVPIVHGVVAVIVIIKLVLAVGVIGFISLLIHTFGGFKSYFGREEPIIYSDPHQHEYSEFPSIDGEKLHHYRRTSIDGGRALDHSIAKRNLNLRKSLRVKRSIESDNCRRRAICRIHARAGQNPFYSFQLYFISKDGLAKYWDHKERTHDECNKVFPCRN